MSGACSCCSGTDSAKECAQGWCYAEAQQRDEDAAREAEWQEEQAQQEEAYAAHLRELAMCDQRLMVDP